MTLHMFNGNNNCCGTMTSGVPNAPLCFFVVGKSFGSPWSANWYEKSPSAFAQDNPPLPIIRTHCLYVYRTYLTYFFARSFLRWGLLKNFSAPSTPLFVLVENSRGCFLVEVAYRWASVRKSPSGCL